MFLSKKEQCALKVEKWYSVFSGRFQYLNVQEVKNPVPTKNYQHSAVNETYPNSFSLNWKKYRVTQKKYKGLVANCVNNENFYQLFFNVRRESKLKIWYVTFWIWFSGSQVIDFWSQNSLFEKVQKHVKKGVSDRAFFNIF